jgi:hypothetical protein
VVDFNKNVKILNYEKEAVAVARRKENDDVIFFD